MSVDKLRPEDWVIGGLALLLAVAVVVDLAVERFSPQTHIPTIGDSREETRFVFAAIAATFTALKFLLHIHFSLFGWGFYVAAVTAGALVYFAAKARKSTSSSSLA